jgi:NADH-quinone oxidoreductase subunit G
MPQVTFTIDGAKVTCEKGTMVLQAALDNGIFVPHYCYHPALSVAGNCRMCLVEIVPKPPPNAPPGWKPPPQKPAISCATEAAEGLEVVTTSKMVKDAREGVLELLLANHPLDCPVCDQAGECDLQDFSFEYGRDHARFAEDKKIKHTKDFGPEVRLYGNRCINCTRCVRFTQEIIGTGDICQVNRGDSNVVDVFPGRVFDSLLSGNVVDICPVGALVSRDFLHKARVWQLDETKSVCPHCATGCSIEIHTRDEEIMRLKPRSNPEVNGFWMCDAGRLGYGFAQAPGRLRSYTRKAAEGRERLGFHGAVDAIAKALAEAGDGAWALASAWMTNEELWLLRALVPPERTALLARPPWPEQRFFPKWGDSERNPSLPGQTARGKLFADGATFVIEADRNPNRAGARRVLGEEACGEPRLEAFARACAEGRVAAALVFAGMPDFTPPAPLLEALGKVPFVAAVDILDGPLVALATLAAPGAAWAEKEGTFTNGRATTQRFFFARPTPGEVRPELELLHALLARGGKAAGAFSPGRTFGAMAAEVEGFRGLTWEGLAPRGPVWGPHVAAAKKETAPAALAATAGAGRGATT